MDLQNKSTPSGNKQAAHYLALGLTLVPYWAYNAHGELAPFCRWVRLRPGETVAQAAVRLSVAKPQPVWTPQLKARVQRMFQALQKNAPTR